MNLKKSRKEQKLLASKVSSYTVCQTEFCLLEKHTPRPLIKPGTSLASQTLATAVWLARLAGDLTKSNDALIMNIIHECGMY